MSVLFALLLAALVISAARVYQLYACVEEWRALVDEQAKIHKAAMQDIGDAYQKAMQSLRDKHAAELLEQEGAYQKALQRAVNALSDEQVAQIQKDIEQARVARACATVTNEGTRA